MEPEDIVERGAGRRACAVAGGAGFGTGQKWSFLPKDVFPRYLAVNGDEGEPSTFKDHMLVERDPHQLIEGIVITAYAIQCAPRVHLPARRVRARRRAARAGGRRRVRDAASSARTSSAPASTSRSSLHRGAGCYIAGDETGLLSSLEGERAMPRIKPPFPAVQGLYAAPTVVNNVETLSTVPHIIERAASGTRRWASNRSTGTRIFSVSGHVERPGNYEVELGITFRDLIEGLAGGVRGGKELEVLHPRRRVVAVADRRSTSTRRSTWTTCRASSRRCSAPARSWCSTRTSTRCSSRGGSRSSSPTSRCGKCTPCREGSGWIEKVLYRMSHGHGRPDDLDLLLDVRQQHRRRASTCRSRRPRSARSARARCRRS